MQEDEALISAQDVKSELLSHYVGRKVVKTGGGRIGKVRRLVFHPSKKVCIGFLVKRPDVALMFHRKDIFIAYDSFELDDDNRIAVDLEAKASSGPAACKRLGVDLDECTLWDGMAVVCEDGTELGYVRDVAVEEGTGNVVAVLIAEGFSADTLLGRRSVPTSLIKGFKLGVGSTIVGRDFEGEDSSGETLGAIIVANEAAQMRTEGGLAEKAAHASNDASRKAREMKERAKPVMAEAGEKASSAIASAADQTKSAVAGIKEQTKPVAQEVGKKAGSAVDAGVFAIGKRLGKASDMFSDFKEEYKKAARGEDSASSQDTQGKD